MSGLTPFGRFVVVSFFLILGAVLALEFGRFLV